MNTKLMDDGLAWAREILTAMKKVALYFEYKSTQNEDKQLGKDMAKFIQYGIEPRAQVQRLARDQQVDERDITGSHQIHRASPNQPFRCPNPDFICFQTIFFDEQEDMFSYAIRKHVSLLSKRMCLHEQANMCSCTSKCFGRLQNVRAEQEDMSY